MRRTDTIYYVDITLRSEQNLEVAIQEAQRLSEQRQAAGIDQPALDQAARQGFSNGAFEDVEEDGSSVVEEFFPVELKETSDTELTPMAPLTAKLDAKTRQLDS